MSRIVPILAAVAFSIVAAQPAAATWYPWKPKPTKPPVTPPTQPPSGSSSGGIQVPEPSDLALFGGGVIGLAVGRRLSRAKKTKK